jgi:hypothetical protein
VGISSSSSSTVLIEKLLVSTVLPELLRGVFTVVVVVVQNSGMSLLNAGFGDDGLVEMCIRIWRYIERFLNSTCISMFQHLAQIKDVFTKRKTCGCWCLLHIHCNLRMYLVFLAFPENPAQR